MLGKEVLNGSESRSHNSRHIVVIGRGFSTIATEVHLLAKAQPNGLLGLTIAVADSEEQVSDQS